MNYLIVFAHPNHNSFCKAIADTVKSTAEDKGDTVRVRDLYYMGFDPLLKPSDFEVFSSGNTPGDIRAEQENIKWADVIVFVYPVWWAGMPAILKGYADRVLSSGFGYEYVNGAPKGLLESKKGLLFSTSGSSSDKYSQDGMLDSMKQTTDEGIFKFCGIEVLNHAFYGAVPYVSGEVRNGYLRDAESIIKSVNVIPAGL